MTSPDLDLCTACGKVFPAGQVCDSCRLAAGRRASAGRLAVFGSVDGLTMFLGLALGLIVSRQSSPAVWHAALGGAAGELIGMTSGQWLSDRASGLPVALACGIAGGTACALPAIPFLVLPQGSARLAALGTAAVVAGVIARARPEHGWRAVLDTYGILLTAGTVSGLTGLL